MNRGTVLIGVIVAALIALSAGVYFVMKPGAPATPAPTPGDAKAGITDYDRTLGDPKAPTVMIEYASPMCPICAAFNANEFPRLKAQYIDTGKVFYVFRVYPIGAPDYPVEGIARCLPKEQYFPFLDMMYRSQDKWDPDGHDIPDVRAAILARTRVIGMPADQATRCMDDKATQARTTARAQEAQARFDVTGTPTFVADGQVVYSGEYPFDYIKAMLDDKLAKKP